MKTLLGLIVLLLASSDLAAQVYKWVDEKGTIHFSDKPIDADPSAQKVLRQAPAAQVPDNIRPVIHGERQSSAAQTSPPPARIKDHPNPSVAHRPRYITASDYTINASARQEKDQVIVSGRISGGPECSNLIIFTSATSEKGNLAVGRASVGSVGGNFSRTFQIVDHTFAQDRRLSWAVTRISVECLQ